MHFGTSVDPGQAQKEEERQTKVILADGGPI